MYTVKGKTDKDSLLTEHMPLVKRLAHHMKAKLPPSVEVDDLVQAGMIGLLDAISRYEETHGAQFETYAVLRIRGAMLDELRNSDWLPRSMRQNMRKIETAMSTLQQRLGHPPTESEVAKMLKLSLADYQEMLSDGGGHQLVYYEDFHDDDGNDSFLDRYCSDEDSDPPTLAAGRRLPSGRDRRHRRAAAAREDPDGAVLRGGAQLERNRRRDGRVGIARVAAAYASRGAPARLTPGAVLDWASVAGVLLALAGIVIGQSLEGGKLSSLLQPAAFAIVVVGTFGAVLLQTRFRTFVRGLQMLRLVFAPPADTRAVLARDINTWNLAARRDGLLSLERYMLASKHQFNTKGPAPDRRRHQSRQAAPDPRHRDHRLRDRRAAGGAHLGIGGRLLAHHRHPGRGAGPDPRDGKPHRPEQARFRHRGGLRLDHLRRRHGQPAVLPRSPTS